MTPSRTSATQPGEYLVYDERVWPTLDTPGVDADLAYASAYTERALNRSFGHSQWGIGTWLLSVPCWLHYLNPDNREAGAMLELEDLSLEEDITRALDACQRYLERHGREGYIVLARDDLTRALRSAQQ